MEMGKTAVCLAGLDSKEKVDEDEEEEKDTSLFQNFGFGNLFLVFRFYQTIELT